MIIKKIYIYLISKAVTKHHDIIIYLFYSLREIVNERLLVTY